MITKLILFITIAWPSRTVCAANLIVEPHWPRPSVEIIRRWTEAKVGDEQIWSFRDEAQLASVLSHPDLSQALRDEIWASKISGPPDFRFDREDPDFAADAGRPRGLHLRLSESAWHRLPPGFRHDVYKELARSPKYYPGVLHELSFGSKAGGRDEIVNAMLTEIIGLAADPRDYRELLSHMVETRVGAGLIVTPFLWPRLSEDLRRKLIEDQLQLNSGIGVKCTIRLTAENLGEISATFARPGDPRVATHLASVLKRSSTSVASLDLTEILPPFVRARVNTFAERSGLNCYAAALDADRDDKFATDHVDPIQLEEQLMFGYGFVPPGQKPRVGDLLVFSKLNEHAHPVHAATYITEDLVFTKNGMSRYAPYVLQRREDLVRTYFPDGRYREVAFRRTRAGEEPTGRRYFERHPTRYEHPDCRQELGLLKFARERSPTRF